MRVLIVSGGVIGSATAYFLARAGAEVTVIERAGIACAASGKSGGFLALTGATARRSSAAGPAKLRASRAAG